MFFTLEALEAQKGDSLILHYGPADRPRFVVIDGGPEGVYKNSLRPRLEQLHAGWKRDGKLPIEILMVSHVDDDHINGVIDWVKEIEMGTAVPCRIRTVWYNSFDDVLGNTGKELVSRAASLGDTPPSGSPPLRTFEQAMAVVASIKQGRELRTRVDALNLDLNSGGGMILLDDENPAPLSAPGGLKLQIVAPLKKRLEALQKEWDKHVKANPNPVVLAAFVDRSVPNLASTVVIAEFGGNRMLLTGDARGDDVLEGLQALGLLDADGKAHFDVIKMPHHGSSRNMTLEWLENITADHYAISADGEHSNPDAETVEWICQARGKEKYSLYFTNRTMMDDKNGLDVGKAVRKVLSAHPNSKRKVVYRGAKDLSVKIEVQDAITY